MRHKYIYSVTVRQRVRLPQTYDGNHVLVYAKRTSLDEPILRCTLDMDDLTRLLTELMEVVPPAEMHQALGWATANTRAWTAERDRALATTK